MISIRLPHSLLLVLGLTQKSQVQMHFQNLLLSKLSQKNGKPRNTSHNVHLAQNNDVRFFSSWLEKICYPDTFLALLSYFQSNTVNGLKEID